MEQETTVKKINTITVGSKTFSGRAMVYQCTMCQSRFVDMDDNYRLCPYCGRKIIGIEQIALGCGGWVAEWQQMLVANIDEYSQRSRIADVKNSHAAAFYKGVIQND